MEITEKNKPKGCVYPDCFNCVLDDCYMDSDYEDSKKALRYCQNDEYTEKRRAEARNYYYRHKEEVLRKAKERYQANKEMYRERNHRQHQSYKYKEWIYKYRQTEKYKEYKREYRLRKKLEKESEQCKSETMQPM